MMKQFIIVAFILLISLATGTTQQVNSVKADVVVWKKCINVTELGNTCMQIVENPNNLTFVVELIIANKVVLTTGLEANETCLDDESLLLIMADISGLGIFDPLIKALIKEYGHIPAEVFSICLDIYNVTYTPLPNNQEQVAGCSYLNSTIMCWKGSCLYKGVDSFGCFQFVVPTGTVVKETQHKFTPPAHPPILLSDPNPKRTKH
eukprot:TRINITY_DN16018_c0_g1_i1.p1 TRINITY_DN16018_c0_g1~~TRINITY_DN16018_c0_g1_i1.p1  ORF type:complete len:230 (-),score=49.75 TRINITY_DN16018_c0_g1_i1:138-755(-)